MTRRIPIGIDDFRKLRENDDALYVDKSGFVADVLRSGAEVLLFTRPRRFGKTLNLSMLGYYLERSDADLTPLFADLDVWDAGDVREHFQAHPVISLTLNDVKSRTFDDCIKSLSLTLKREFQRHSATLQPVMTASEGEEYGRFIDRSAAREELAGSLLFLSSLLQRAHGRRTFLLLDEYDTPIHAAYVHGCYPEAINFFRNFFSAGLKSNRHLEKGVLTGILRIPNREVRSNYGA